MSTFKYDVVSLIRLVKEHPCLWNKSVEEFKDRAARKEAWDKIFEALEPSYQDLQDEEQRLIAEPIMSKWTNVRDSFVKSLRHKTGRSRKKYIFHKYLTFLLSDQTEETNPLSNIDSDSEKDVDNEIIEPRSKKRKISEEDQKKIITLNINEPFTEIDEYRDPRVMNEDEAFFASLLPSVVTYSEEERLEFRIGVLKLMKQIKRNRNLENDD